MDSCPSDKEINSFLAGDGLVEVGVHLRSCQHCHQTLERLSDDDNLRRATALLGDPTWDWTGGANLKSIVEHLRRERPFLEQSGLARITDSREVILDPPEDSGMLGRLGPYDVEQEIGRRGMGVVFRARDRTTDRGVALKVLLAGTDDARTRRHFIQEVRAASKVEHDHVVRLYSTSDPDDRVPYFTMVHVSGQSLAEFNHKSIRIDPEEVAEIIAQVASGLQAAHLAGLVHSDVKPANIQFDSATGRAKIGDFGLARVAADEPHLSREGILAGTPVYLSPEQARRGSTADLRSDIYSLGVTLYESLTGEIPFRGKPHRFIHQVINDEPQPPRVFNDAIPKDLETICLMAMTKEPSKRYPTASAFSEDLRRFLKGEPIQARPVGAVERGWRWCRNHRTVASLTLLSLTALVFLAVGSAVAAVWIS